MDKNLLEILSGHNFQKNIIIEKVINQKANINDLLNIAVSDFNPQSWRAAWILNDFIDENLSFFNKNQEKIISAITNKNDGHQRELLKIITKLEINPDVEGKLFNICEKIWLNINKSPSVRTSAFDVLLKIAEKYPELKTEIKLLASKEFIETLSPGIAKSLRQKLTKL